MLGLLLSVSCSITPRPKSVSPSAPAVAKPKQVLNLRRQPGEILVRDEDANFWNVQIASDGSAELSAVGTMLISNGDFVGNPSPESLDQLTALVDQLRATPSAMRMCMHADDFEVYDFRSDLFANECISQIDGSGLEKLYRATEDLIRTTSWRLVRPRPSLGA